MNATNDGDRPHGHPHAGLEAVHDPGPSSLASILANLSREICLPLGRLQEGICQIIGSKPELVSEVERNQARTLLTVCEDLGRLTCDCLGDGNTGQS